MRKSLVVVLMCAAGLVACDKGQQKAEGAAAPAGGAGPADAAAPAQARTGKPVRKAGLWQITYGQSTGLLCVSNATEASPRADVFAALRSRRGVGSPGARPGGPGGPGVPGGDRARGPGGERGPGAGQGGERRGPGGGFGGGGFGSPACPPTITKTDTGWTSTSSCTRSMGDRTFKLATSLTLTGDLQTRYVVKGTRSAMDVTAPVSITGLYKGACPAGMNPGDYKGADGQIRNLLQGRRGPGGGGGAGGRAGGGAGPGVGQRV